MRSELHPKVVHRPQTPSRLCCNSTKSFTLQQYDVQDLATGQTVSKHTVNTCTLVPDQLQHMNKVPHGEQRTAPLSTGRDLTGTSANTSHSRCSCCCCCACMHELHDMWSDHSPVCTQLPEWGQPLTTMHACMHPCVACTQKSRGLSNAYIHAHQHTAPPGPGGEGLGSSTNMGLDPKP